MEAMLHLMGQIGRAKPEIDALELQISQMKVPRQGHLFIDTVRKSLSNRCEDTASLVVQTLMAHGPELLLAGGLFFNEMLGNILPSFKEKAKAYVNGKVTSNVISTFLCEQVSQLSSSELLDYSQSNDYPDLTRASFDYSYLPDVGKPGFPSKRGTRPINVPDGLEIKTSKNGRLSLDCHGPKMGLFLYAPWTPLEGQIGLSDLYLAFLKTSDFKKGKATSRQTTIKWNVSPASFISVFTGELFGKESHKERSLFA